MSLDDTETIGERLQRLREEKGISREQLVVGLISAEMLLIIENNMGLPSKGILKELASRLGVNVQYFRRTENKLRKRHLWMQSGSSMTIEGRKSCLFQHDYFPRQWLFCGDIVLADTRTEAIIKLTQHARLLDFYGKKDYWIPFSSLMNFDSRNLPKFAVRKKNTRHDRIYKHSLEPNLWRWNDYVCYALTYEEWYQTVMREVVSRLRSFS